MTVALASAGCCPRAAPARRPSVFLMCIVIPVLGGPPLGIRARWPHGPRRHAQHRLTMRTHPLSRAVRMIVETDARTWASLVDGRTGGLDVLAPFDQSPGAVRVDARHVPPRLHLLG